jgi:hypothetical protein
MVKAPTVAEVKATRAARRAAAGVIGSSLSIAAGASGALSVKETAGGYTYPDIPEQLEQNIPDYYRKSRQERGLPALPDNAGRMARKIGRYVAELPDDPDNRGSIEATIAQVLVAAAQSAEQAGDGGTAQKLAEIGGLWAKKVVKAGGRAPTIDPDKPLSGVAFDYGFLHAPDEPVFFGGLSQGEIATGAGVLAMAWGLRKGNITQGAIYGAVAFSGVAILLGAFGKRD